VKIKLFFSETICIFLLIIIKLIRLIIPIRINSSFSSRIGHFVGVITLFIYRQEKKFIDLFFVSKKISNIAVYNLFKKKIRFIPKIFSTIMPRLIKTNNKYKIVRNLSFYYNDEFKFDIRIFESRDVLNLIDKTKIKFSFAKKDQSKIVKKNNIKYNLKKIICIHVRDEGYLKKNITNYTDKKANNVNIQSYKKTIIKLIELGFTVIRVGKDHNKFLDIKNKHYIDLFKEKIWNDELELFLISKCKFFIGTHSGGSMAALYMFKKPTLFTNFVPIGKVFSYSKKIFFIPKKIKKNNNVLSINDMFLKKLAFLEKKELFKKNKSQIIDNSPGEILDATLDLINCLKNEKKFFNQNKKLLLNFKKVFKNNIEKSSFKSFHGKLNFNIAPSFLKNNSLK